MTTQTNKLIFSAAHHNQAYAFFNSLKVANKTINALVSSAIIVVQFDAVLRSNGAKRVYHGVTPDGVVFDRTSARAYTHAVLVLQKQHTVNVRHADSVARHTSDYSEHNGTLRPFVTDDCLSKFDAQNWDNGQQRRADYPTLQSYLDHHNCGGAAPAATWCVAGYCGRPELASKLAAKEIATGFWADIRIVEVC